MFINPTDLASHFTGKCMTGEKTQPNQGSLTSHHPLKRPPTL